MSRLFSWLLRWTWWARKWFVLLRERQLRVHAAADLIAAELNANAEIVRAPHYRQDLSTRLDLQLDSWERHRAELYPIWRKDPSLWFDLQAAYERLRWVATRGGEAPTEEALQQLAERLRTARY